MRRIRMIFVLFFTAILLGAPSESYAGPNDDLKAEISALLQEGEQLKQEQTKIYQESVALKSTLDGLKLKDAAIRRASVILDQKKLGLSLEAAKIETDKAALRAHPTCNGTYEPQEYARRKAWCDAEWAKIRERVRLFNLKVTDVNQQITLNNQDRRALSQATLAWTENTRKLNGRYADLAAKRRAWFKRVLEFRDRRAFDQLKRLAGASQECANIPGIGEFERDINGASERAHRCLQALWDGASKPPAKKPPRKK